MLAFRTTFRRMSAYAVVSFWGLAGSTVGHAAVHLSLGGSHSESNAGLQKIESGAGSGSLAFDLGDYFRLGYTHRQELASTSGWNYAEDTKIYTAFVSKSHVVSHSVDLTIILYAGEVFMPYVFAGIGVKSYDIENKEEGKATERTRVTIPNPNGGGGLSIRLNQQFSLKLSHTVSPGIRQLPGKEAESTTDSYSQVGISYAL